LLVEAMLELHAQRLTKNPSDPTDPTDLLS